MANVVTVNNMNGGGRGIGSGGQTGVIARMARLQVGDGQSTGQRRRVDVEVEIDADGGRRAALRAVVDDVEVVVPENGRVVHHLAHQTRQTQSAALFHVHLRRTHHLGLRF